LLSRCAAVAYIACYTSGVPLEDELQALIEKRREIDRALLERHAQETAVLFTDIVGSTAFFEQRGDIEGLALVHRHNELLFPLVSAHNGRVVKTIGDSIMAVFSVANDAVACAVAMQQKLRDETGTAAAEKIRIRIGVHWGRVLKDGDDVFGDTVNTAARVAGAQLRITARLVDVETGVVAETAKVTGPLETVFALQDDVVRQLWKVPEAKRRPKPKEPKKTLQAYEAYARSLAVSSDVDKIDSLRRALDLDPDFHYALYDLRALESRLNRYAKQGKEIVDERTAAQLARMKDASLSLNDRNTAATQAMAALIGQYRYAALLDVATQIYDSKLPPGEWVHAREHAAFYMFLSLMQLKKTDLALQAGERYLQQWPAGSFAQSIDLQMRATIEQRHRHEEALKEGPRELERIAREEQELEQRGQLSAVRARNFAFQRCSVLVRSERWDEAIEACKAFGAAYRTADDGDHLLKLSRLLLARCHAERGDFKSANDEALRLLDDHPVWARENSVEIIRRTWPQP
jgi:hypothetical protein